MTKAEDKHNEHNPGSSNANRKGGNKAGTNAILVSEEGNFIILREPLYRTADGRIVHENHLDARWLYGAVGARIPRAEAEANGLI